jgi:hypothetical protein
LNSTPNIAQSATTCSSSADFPMSFFCCGRVRAAA